MFLLYKLLEINVLYIMSLVLQNLQSNQRIKLDDQSPFIIGRGNVVGCFDKRVSRNHGRITCTLDGKIRLAALHCNPCFFTRNGVPPVVQLNKDEEETLAEGDCLGLLPNAFWFQIKTLKDEIKNETSTKTQISDNPVVKKEITEDNSQSKDTEASESVNSKPATSEDRAKPVPTSNTDAGASKCFGDPDFEKTRRLPLWMYKIDEPDQPNNIPNKHKIPNNQGVANKRAKIEPDIKEEPNDNSDGTQMVNEVAAIDVPSTSNTENSDESTLNQPDRTDKAAGESSRVTSHKEGYESDVNNSEDVPPKRPICQYEGNCYRKNPQHKLEYCHPGDADFVLYEDRPVCQYGVACYRKNERHRVEFRHPAPSSSQNNVSPSSSQSSLASSPLPAKRRRKKVQKQSPVYGDEDEYDLEDPFINDATSDEYVPSQSDSEEEELEDVNATPESD